VGELGAVPSDDLAAATPGHVGKESWFSSEKARTTLGRTTRPAEDAIEDCASSLR